ncbi:pirin family protein [Halopseudomonas phragmitis]|uniref:Quercetin 2,3-dioxygenase n=1 Tax=Halopseudomonas phragmitis TaxID=1931241 RepID=A0A1V0B8M3_9GAMM|nr:pirin family protein [Halopseudomonas phragmitis]AQZ96285.1 quercetin 2,3-dioxygenase [Halopseudomonas phragmitis]
MLQVRLASERGAVSFGWLNSRHSFSFGHYYDPAHMGYGPLRVINEDKVQPGKGFETHGHRDMEIISYVLEGALAHKDSTGSGSVIRPGDVQRMSAGTGILHSEFNASDQDPVHFLQIWIIPQQSGLAPSYEEKHFSDDQRRGQWRLIGAPDGRDGAVTIHQDINLYAAIIESGDSLSRALSAKRKTWLQVVSGQLQLRDLALSAGDGVAIQEDGEIELQANTRAEVLLFDMTDSA